jgi:hypothetical protein
MLYTILLNQNEKNNKSREFETIQTSYRCVLYDKYFQLLTIINKSTDETTKESCSTYHWCTSSKMNYGIYTPTNFECLPKYWKKDCVTCPQINYLMEIYVSKL